MHLLGRVLKGVGIMTTLGIGITRVPASGLGRAHALGAFLEGVRVVSALGVVVSEVLSFVCHPSLLTHMRGSSTFRRRRTLGTAPKQHGRMSFGDRRRLNPNQVATTKKKEPMATVLAGFTMSLDGFVADPDDGVGHLFDWYDTGDVAFEWPGNDMVSHTTPVSAAHLRALVESAGALVVGRRIFDITAGWGGRHPIGVPVFVVTHSVPEGWPRDDAPFTFVTDGVESAIAQAKAVAGDKRVGVAGPNTVQQCLNAGLVNEVHIDLAPVILGAGIRFFDNLARTPVLLDNPTVAEGDRVTHLTYRVRRNG